MRRQFDVPEYYRSPIIGSVKKARQKKDPRNKDMSPYLLDFGPVRFHIARHLGFCYGVENAIEIAYRALRENEDKRLFMLSEMIHNPQVNEDLESRGLRFLRSTTGEELLPFDTLVEGDIVIIPAFGASLEIQADLIARGVDIKTYDTTCPFILRVWRRSDQIGKKNCTIIVHGKRYHEETRATFSYIRRSAPVVVVRDIDETRDLCRIITGEEPPERFFELFPDRFSDGFDPERDLNRIGVVNQTTMLATETQAIANLLKATMASRYGEENVRQHFEDTSDTLCYATHENQVATRAMFRNPVDLALVVGGYNSSNTSHLMSICEAEAPAYFIKDADEILSPERLRHFDYPAQVLRETADWLPKMRPVDIALTAGASCPDSLLDQVIHRIHEWFPEARPISDVLASFDGVVVN